MSSKRQKGWRMSTASPLVFLQAVSMPLFHFPITFEIIFDYAKCIVDSMNIFKRINFICQTYYTSRCVGLRVTDVNAIAFSYRPTSLFYDSKAL